MATPLSSWRYGESGLDDVGAAFTTAELDFNLGLRQGIEIGGIMGYMYPTVTDLDASNSASLHAMQTLHVETGALEDIEGEAGDYPSFRPDREIIYRQMLVVAGVEDNTNHTDAVDLLVQPSGLWIPPVPVMSAINLTHRLEVFATATVVAIAGIWYRYVQLSDQELSFFFARRR